MQQYYRKDESDSPRAQAPQNPKTPKPQNPKTPCIWNLKFCNLVVGTPENIRTVWLAFIKYKYSVI